MENSFTKDAWDIHVHCNPSLFPRWGDGVDLIRGCKKAGMRGVVLKAHHGSTVEYAYALNRHEKNFEIFGGLALNYFVGGLNPYAVDAAMSLGARIIWLPTIHAQNHEKALGTLGGFSFQEAGNKISPQKGISLLREDGEIKGEVVQILSILNGTNTVLATGHISSKEILALKRHIKEKELNIKLLITHTFFKTPGLSGDDIEELKGEDVWFEIDNHSTLEHIASCDAEGVAKYIKRHPDAQWVMVSDSGQKENPPSPEALNAFAKNLEEAGVGRGEIRAMCTKNPERLLGV